MIQKFGLGSFFTGFLCERNSKIELILVILITLHYIYCQCDILAPRLSNCQQKNEMMSNALIFIPQRRLFLVRASVITIMPDFSSTFFPTDLTLYDVFSSLTFFLTSPIFTHRINTIHTFMNRTFQRPSRKHTRNLTFQCFERSSSKNFRDTPISVTQ